LTFTSPDVIRTEAFRNAPVSPASVARMLILLMSLLFGAAKCTVNRTRSGIPPASWRQSRV
jgi:hypothetical protein